MTNQHIVLNKENVLSTNNNINVNNIRKSEIEDNSVQKNPTSGQWTIGIPVEVAEGAELEPKDTVRFKVEGPGRILIEVLR